MLSYLHLQSLTGRLPLDFKFSHTFVNPLLSTSRVLRIISRTIALLYYMVFITPEPYRLGRKLHFIPSRHFHGTRHIFNVTMGRFSFADSPCWLNDADRAQYEQTVGTSSISTVRLAPDMADDDGAIVLLLPQIWQRIYSSW